MTVVDTSALMAILLGEPEADVCMTVLEKTRSLTISTVTVAVALAAADHHGVGAEMRRLFDGLGFEFEAPSQHEAQRVAEAYARWGKGPHPAGLNFGDCFAYSLAVGFDAPLLYVGRGFAQTDVRPALEVSA